MIEAAMTLPLLLLVCVGIIEFGRLYQTWQVMTNAAREGARIAVLPTQINGGVDARVRQYLQMGGLKYGQHRGRHGDPRERLDRSRGNRVGVARHGDVSVYFHGAAAGGPARRRGTQRLARRSR